MLFGGVCGRDLFQIDEGLYLVWILWSVRFSGRCSGYTYGI